MQNVLSYILSLEKPRAYIPLLALALVTCGKEDPKPAPHDGIEYVDNLVDELMTRYQVPGLSLAVSQNGKLVYVKAYGVSDKAPKTETITSNLFRIASLSKPITSVAIFSLMEQGKLGLDDKIFGDSALLGNEYGTPPYNAKVRKLTVRNLLQHTAGGWSNDNNDPMFKDASWSVSQLISETIDHDTLEFEPGSSYAYSNFGYCLLGRVVEKLSGSAYEDYVREHILAPAGITDMVIGGNSISEIKPNEVHYYPQDGEDPYQFNLTRMDSPAGWIASASDLVLFSLHADGLASVPDLVSDSTISLMTTTSSANQGYACGWVIEGTRGWSHSGSLPGTSSQLARGNNGITCAIVTNTRNTNFTLSDGIHELAWTLVENTHIYW